jgi:hypothetical protein
MSRCGIIKYQVVIVYTIYLKGIRYLLHLRVIHLSLDMNFVLPLSKYMRPCIKYLYRDNFLKCSVIMLIVEDTYTVRDLLMHSGHLVQKDRELLCITIMPLGVLSYTGPRNGIEIHIFIFFYLNYCTYDSIFSRSLLASPFTVGTYTPLGTKLCQMNIY